MKSIKQVLFLVTLLFNMGFASHTPLLELYQYQDSSITRIGDKLYVDLSRLVFDSTGIFIESDQQEYYPIPHIAYDNGGYFFPLTLECENQFVEAQTCPRGHPSGMKDGLCDFPGCPFNRWGK
ncbi:MAG: hypothetical protein AB7N99_01265 [Simkaniaceae bacterium]